MQDEDEWILGEAANSDAETRASDDAQAGGQNRCAIRVSVFLDWSQGIACDWK